MWKLRDTSYQWWISLVYYKWKHSRKLIWNNNTLGQYWYIQYNDSKHSHLQCTVQQSQKDSDETFSLQIYYPSLHLSTNMWCKTCSYWGHKHGMIGHQTFNFRSHAIFDTQLEHVWASPVYTASSCTCICNYCKLLTPSSFLFMTFIATYF